MNSLPPSVSVITAHYNTPLQLVRLRNSLERQTFPLNRFEWVLVDDGSPDGPPAWFSDYTGSLQLVPITLDHNTGRSGARNKALQASRGKILIFIDADMEPHQAWLEILVRAVEVSRAVVVGKLLPPPGARDALTRYLHSRGAIKHPAGSRIPGKYFVSSNSALERRWLEKSGGFDETFSGWGGEDLDLGLRLERAGAQFVYESRADTVHHHRLQWEEVERRYLAYGRDVVPLILERHPNAEKLLSLDSLRPPLERSCCMLPWKRYLLRQVCRSRVYRFLRSLTMTFPSLPWPDAMFDFMIFYLYSRRIVQLWSEEK